MRDRKDNRLKKVRYRKPGYYYVTLRTYYKKCLFGDIINGEMIKNDIGYMIENIWYDIPKFYKGFNIDEFIIMPNHVHGIIKILSGDDSQTGEEQGRDSLSRNTPSGKAWEPSRTNSPTQLSIFDLMNRYKSMTSNGYLKLMKFKFPGTRIGKLWHRSYYDRIIRNNDDLNRIRKYIKDNPMNWDK